MAWVEFRCTHETASFLIFFFFLLFFHLAFVRFRSNAENYGFFLIVSILRMFHFAQIRFIFAEKCNDLQKQMMVEFIINFHFILLAKTKNHIIFLRL